MSNEGILTSLMELGKLVGFVTSPWELRRAAYLRNMFKVIIC